MMSDQPRPDNAGRTGQVDVVTANPARSTAADGRSRLDEETLRERLSNTSPLEDRRRALFDLFRGTTGTPSVDAALLLKRIKDDPNHQIRAGAVRAYATLTGVASSEKFSALAKRVCSDQGSPIERDIKIRNMIMKDALSLSKVPFRQKSELLENMAKSCGVQREEECIFLGLSLLDDETISVATRVEVLDGLVYSPSLNARIVAAKLTGQLKTLAESTRDRYLRRALDDGATIPPSESRQRQRAAPTRIVAIEAIPIVVETPYLPKEKKLAALQRRTSGVAPDIRFRRALGALAVSSGKDLETVSQMIEQCRHKDPQVRLPARNWLEGQNLLTPGSLTALDAYING